MYIVYISFDVCVHSFIWLLCLLLFLCFCDKMCVSRCRFHHIKIFHSWVAAVQMCETVEMEWERKAHIHTIYNRLYEWKISRAEASWGRGWGGGGGREKEQKQGQKIIKCYRNIKRLVPNTDAPCGSACVCVLLFTVEIPFGERKTLIRT